jgi:hypothetical protein
MALALAIFALVVIGGMVAGSFFAGLLEQQGGRNLLVGTEAAEVAEGELWRLVASVPAASLLALTAGGEPLTLAPVPGPRVTIVRRVARLADNLFLAETRAVRRDAEGGSVAERSVGLLASLGPDSASGAQILLPIPRRAWLQLY